jgi:hypothetical protein
MSSDHRPARAPISITTASRSTRTSASSDVSALTNGSKTVVTAATLTTFTVTGLNAGATSGTATYTISGSALAHLYAFAYDGKLYFGPDPVGAGLPDVTLYRGGPDQLQTDDEFKALILTATGFTGSTEDVRVVGGTATGAPASGAHNVGDIAVAVDGHIFVCTVAGTPGTWVEAGTGTFATAAQGATADAALPKVAGGASVENIGAVESNVLTVGATGATEEMDTSLYGVFDLTMDEACALTFSNPAPSGKATVFILILRGAFTPTFPASVDWGDGSAPTYTTPSQYVFTTVDAGTTWLGQQVAKAYG